MKTQVVTQERRRRRAAIAGAAVASVALALLPASPAVAASNTLAPAAITTTGGTIGADQSVTNLSIKDQTGTQNTYSKYVEFSPSGSTAYSGYRTYALPSAVAPSSVTSLQITVNYRGPAVQSQTWTWSLYNWSSHAWVAVGTNASAPDWGAWTTLTFNTASGSASYVSAGGGIRLRSSANNATDSSDIDYESIVVTSAPPTDTAPPSVPTALGVAGVTSSSVSLSWGASTDNVGVTAYEVILNGGATPVATVGTTNATIGGLAAATGYSFAVKARDAAGNRSGSSATVSATTAANPVDGTPPTVPAGLAVASKTAVSISLTWMASTDAVGVTGYEVFQNGGAVPAATVTGTSATLGTLVPNTVYSFTVKARDAAGNRSGASSALSVTTSVAGSLWQPALISRWQYQLQGDAAFASTGGINVNICSVPATGGACVSPSVFDIDLYVDPAVAGNNSTANTAAVTAIHAAGGHAICYVDAGGIENYRPDYAAAQAWEALPGHGAGSLFGKPYPGFPDEVFANINNDKGQRDFMLTRAQARVDKCKQAGFDAVEFDLVDTYETDLPGYGGTALNTNATNTWSISPATELIFARALAAMAHTAGLSVALKNDNMQIVDLVGNFDFAVNESCLGATAAEAFCLTSEIGTSGYDAFVSSGKAVFQVEYTMKPGSIPNTWTDSDTRNRCGLANNSAHNFNSIHKNLDFTLFSQPYRPCR